ncbi:APC family permease [Acinetobacter sp. ANC 4173]|uniref:APC family permease n=1 Tax=Acinetobacter sp. ANC 4173 TaxID=2529837 RepID=UPI00103CEE1C|nr:APC family permease [Acinetobacter sp. ANC 4173]TCB80610.1 APC family permease [Acinetobacter sp. ANC 4173]
MDNRSINIRKLTLAQVIIVGIAYMTPMTVFDTFGIVSDITNGRVPLAYIFALFSMLLTAFSYARLSQQTDRPGSAYTYTAESCGNSAGFFVGWCSLLDYILLPLINALLAGIYLHALMPAVPYAAWVFVAAGLVTLVNCFRIHILANLSLLFVFVPLILLVVFIYLVISGIGSNGYEHVLTLKPLFNGDTSIVPLITGASILCFSFLGFDAVTTLSHETKDPKKTIPRAVMLTTFIGGFIFISASWFIQLYFPDNARFKDPEAALPEIALYVGGALFQALFLVGQIMNTVASGLASHASAARLIHIMGRDGIFHKGIFGSVNQKLGTPLYSVLAIGMVSLTAMFLDLSTVLNLISFGALIAFTAVNFSVFMKFYVHEKQRAGFKAFFLNLCLPVLSVLSLVAMWLNLESSALHFGLGWLTVGIVLFVYKKIRKQSIVLSNA